MYIKSPFSELRQQYYYEAKTVCINPFPPMSVKWHLYILLSLTPDDFTRQWGTP